MGILDDLVFHGKNYISYKTRDTILGDAARTHLRNEIYNNENISDSAKSKVGEDLILENIRQHVRKSKK